MPSFNYTTFGMTIQSELEIPGLVPSDELDSPDVRISIGRTPASLDKPLIKRVLFQSNSGEYLLDLRRLNVGRYWLRSNHQIIIERNSGAHERDLRLFLLRPVLPVAQILQGNLVLNASAVYFQGKTILLAGVSPQGVSTLAMTLISQGGILISDGACIFSKSQKNILSVLPGPGWIELWEDSLRKFSLTPLQENRIRPQIEKYAVQVERHANYHDVYIPTHLVLMVRTPSSKPSASLLNSLEAFPTLMQCVYQRDIQSAGEKQVNLMKNLADLIRNTVVLKLSLSDDLRQIDKGVEQLFKEMN